MRLSCKLCRSLPISKEPTQVFQSYKSFCHGTRETESKFLPSFIDPNSQSFRSFFLSILRNSAVTCSLPMGNAVHACIIKSGLRSDLIITNNLLHTYCSCFSIADALKVFYEMSNNDVVSWNTIISGFIRIGLSQNGFSYYCEMRRAGFHPSQSSFVSAVLASVEMCSLKNCMQIFCESLKCGFSSDLLVGNALLTAYVKLANIEDSRKIFDGMHNIDEVSMEILLRGYAQQGSATRDVLELFRFCFLVGFPFSPFALSSLLSFCASIEVIDYGIQIHGYIVKVGLSSNVSVVNSLITMYARSYLLKESACLFDEATSHDVVTWNSLIAGYAFNGEGDDGLHYVAKFLSSGMQMNESTFCSFLSSCSTVTLLENAKKAHALILMMQEFSDLGADNVILTMYCKCENLNYATRMFNTIRERDAISFNLLIGLFRRAGLHERAVELFSLAQLEGFKADEVTYSSIISSCSVLFDLEVGWQIHNCIIKTGFHMIASIGNSLLELYSWCGRLDDMERIFGEIDIPSVFTWNIKAMAYAHFGLFSKAIRIWEKMKEMGLDFNEFSYCGIIDACTHIEAPLIGEQIHAQMKKSGLDFDTTLLNSLLTMYASCGMMEKASTIFHEIPVNDFVSWNAMVCGFAQNGSIRESVSFYLMMNWRGLKPNYMTFASVSKCCADCSQILLGLQFHAEVIKRGFDSYVSVFNAFITMYARCGSILDSSKIFMNTVTNRDLVTWNSMICAFAHHGYGKEALDTFIKMKSCGTKPNAVTFVGVLSACGHAGLISEAYAEFLSMYHDHGIVPGEEHYACVIDILCRAGRLKEAKELIGSMPFNSGSLIWRTLLSACRTNENIELGLEAAEKLMQLEPNDSSAYVLLANICASANKMEEKAELRRRIGERNVNKEIGYSLIWC